jgi:hypothetical protein
VGYFCEVVLAFGAAVTVPEHESWLDSWDMRLLNEVT